MKKKREMKLKSEMCDLKKSIISSIKEDDNYLDLKLKICATESVAREVEKKFSNKHNIDKGAFVAEILTEAYNIEPENLHVIFDQIEDLIRTGRITRTSALKCLINLVKHFFF